MATLTLSRPIPLAFVIALSSAVGLAQSPWFSVTPRSFAQGSTTMPSLAMTGPSGELFVLVADTTPGCTPLFGANFDLQFSSSLVLLSAGVLNGGYQQSVLPFSPGVLPTGFTGYLQYGSFDPALGLLSMRSSNLDSFSVHNATDAVTFDFLSPSQLSGVFETQAFGRLQALPPSTRTVRPLPPEAFPVFVSGTDEPLHPSGSRFQFAFRAQDLASNGLPEQLTAIRWRPLFGTVTNETYQQFELLAAHTAAVPNYAIDPWSALPAFPNSGLSTQFAQNPISAAVTVISGNYNVQAQDLLPNGYMPFPALQIPFIYDGTNTLLLETRCSPNTAGGAPQNHMAKSIMVFSAPLPVATVAASAGLAGQPTVLNPLLAASGQGQAALPEWELDFQRTTSEATTPWRIAFTGSLNPDYQTPIIASYTPPGTSIAIEYRGRNGVGTTPSAWSNVPDIADGMFEIQLRVRLEANPTTGAVPWVDAVHVPYQ